jgi:UDP-N-acetyl-D-glucosamine/UDP-N-acetyl-D-galactosamine dehydrogenase
MTIWGDGSQKKLAILGLTFKENVTDLRNSRVVDIIHELRDFGVETFVADPYADSEMAHEEYGMTLTNFDQMSNCDAVILAVAHDIYRELGLKGLTRPLKKGGLFVDIKSAFKRTDIESMGFACWRL